MNTRESGKASSSLGLQDFDLLRVIGRGSYAKVLLVRLKKTDRIYAMKVVKKELVNDDEVSTVIFFYLYTVKLLACIRSWVQSTHHRTKLSEMLNCLSTISEETSIFVLYFFILLC
jgi:serine/threonine protein kinase